MRHPGNLARVGSSHCCVCAALPLLPSALTVPWTERFPEAALSCLSLKVSSTQETLLSCLGRISPLLLSLCHEVRPPWRRQVCGTKGMGTQISRCLVHLEEGETSPGRSTLSLNPGKDPIVGGEGSPQLPGTSSPDRERRNLERQMMTMDDTIPQKGQSWERIPFLPSSSCLNSQVQTSRQVRRILIFHIPPASKIQGNSRALQWIFPRSD